MIKDVMVHLDGTSADERRLAAASSIAILFESHVIGLFLNVLPMVTPAEGDSAGAVMVTDLLEKARQAGNKTEALLVERLSRLNKPVEIRRKKFGGKNLSRYRTIFNIVLISAGCGAVTYFAGNFLLHSPKVLLLKPEQVEVTGNRIVSREAVLAPFYKDRGHSVLRIPLDMRRADVEKISWVQSASVQRILPNRIRIDISERTPVAFVRNGSEIALID